MYRRLSVLPIIFVIFIVLFLSSDTGFGSDSATSSHIASQAVQSVNSADSRQNSRYGTNLYEQNLSVSGNSLNRGSFGSSLNYSNYGRGGSYYSPSGSSSSIGRNYSSYLGRYSIPLAGQSGSNRLGSLGGNTDYSQIRNQYNRRFQNSAKGKYEGSLNPITIDSIRRQQTVDDNFSLESKEYLRSDRSYSLEIRSDVYQPRRETYHQNQPVTDLLSSSPNKLPRYEPVKDYLTTDEIDKNVEKYQKKEIDKSKDSNPDEASKDSDEMKSLAESDPYTGSTVNLDISEKSRKKRLAKLKDFETRSEKRYQVSIKSADKYLVEGKFFSAMDIYNIAGAWKDKDARAYIGMAYANFAVGRHISSSLFLTRAIKSSGDYAAKKVDIAALIGNKQLYEKRLGEVKAMYEASRSDDVAFLLAYLSFHEGDLVKAKECIDSAALKMGNSQALKSLNTVIEKGLADQKP